MNKTDSHPALEDAGNIRGWFTFHAALMTKYQKRGFKLKLPSDHVAKTFALASYNFKRAQIRRKRRRAHRRHKITLIFMFPDRVTRWLMPRPALRPFTDNTKPRKIVSLDDYRP